MGCGRGKEKTALSKKKRKILEAIVISFIPSTEKGKGKKMKRLRPRREEEKGRGHGRASLRRKKKKGGGWMRLQTESPSSPIQGWGKKRRGGGTHGD